MIVVCVPSYTFSSYLYNKKVKFYTLIFLQIGLEDKIFAYSPFCMQVRLFVI